MLRVMTGSLPWLLKNFLSISVHIIWPIMELLKGLAHLSTSDHIHIFSFVALLEQFASARAHLELELLVQGLELLIAKVFKSGHLAEVLEHLVLLANPLLPLEVFVVFICEVHDVRILSCPY